jgi:ribosomal protein S18 acetylase RimI-like enzyme
LAASVRLFKEQDSDSVLKLANSYASFDGTTSEADLAITAHFPTEVPERWKSSKVAQVELMAVHPSHRGLGIGRSLLTKLLENFEEAGADIVLLNCPASAMEAKRLYEEMGFRVRSFQLEKRL